MSIEGTTTRKVLVTGASGQQGGSVLNALLARGHQVRALTRKPDSEWAASAASRGVEVVAGDFTDQESLVRAATGVDTIFLMTTPFEAGIDVETQQGLAMLEAAKQANIGHLVFSSVASADKATGIPHFESKFKVEEAIIASGISHTIVAPVFFMDNITSPWYLPGILDGTLAMPMPADVPLQHIAVEDIGQFVTLIIERRESVFGLRFDIASDEKTGEEVAQILSEKLDRPIGYSGFSPDALREENEDFAIMFEWFIEDGYSVDTAELKAEFPNVSWVDLKSWVDAQTFEQKVAV
ncbi:MAG: NmrA/HSCARG family protein [Rhodothermia bacterium]|nr:MAG: NmrA/HSCARG family protein [Rhodothermia bacterium]